VKYRHKVLTPEIEKRLHKVLNKIAKDNSFQILEFGSDLDHIHLLVNCSPQHYIPDMLKALKGVSARLLMKEYGEELKEKLWNGHLLLQPCQKIQKNRYESIFKAKKSSKVI